MCRPACLPITYADNTPTSHPLRSSHSTCIIVRARNCDGFHFTLSNERLTESCWIMTQASRRNDDDGDNAEYSTCAIAYAYVPTARVW